MFENIIGNKKVIDFLQHDILSNGLPPAILLQGEAFVGKMTIALEIARVLGCQKNAEWNCDCHSCQEQRALSSSDVMLLGSKDCSIEVRVAKNVLLQNKTKASYYLFLRAVRKLTRRFDQNAWDAQDATFIKATPLLVDIEELLAELKTKGVEYFDDESLSRIVDKLELKCDKLQEECMYDSIPISQVRLSLNWLRLKTNSNRKILILENAHKMQEGARNAFLKELEEPPDYATFILTSPSKTSIMPTILSRTRLYVFSKRTKEEEREVLERVFKCKDKDELNKINESSMLTSFFYNMLPIKYDVINEEAIFFWKYILTSDSLDTTQFFALHSFLDNYKDAGKEVEDVVNLIARLNKFKPSIIYTIFLRAMMQALHSSLMLSLCSAKEVERYKIIALYIENAREKVELYNMGLQGVLEDLVEKIRAIF